MAGPASLQKFAGEDLDYGNRVRKQQQQQATWVYEQMSEKQAQIEDEREMERIYTERQAELDERRAMMEAEEMNSRSTIDGAVRDFNQALAEEKREREAQRRMMAYEDNEEEIRNQLTSDLLTENRAATQSHLAPHRYIKYAFKGFSEEQQAAIREEQVRARRNRSSGMSGGASVRRRDIGVASRRARRRRRRTERRRSGRRSRTGTW